MVHKAIISLLTALTLCSYALSQESKEDNTFKAYWDNNLKIESADQRFKIALGGRMQYDMAFLFQDAATKEAIGELKNGTEFRRVRFYNSGQLFKFIQYKVQLDFAGGKVAFKDVYLAFSNIPGIGTFYVGQFNEPLRLEVITSDSYINFMERSFLTDFSPERNNGFMISNEALKSRLGWQVGVFRNADATGNDTKANSRLNVTARVSGLPCKKDEKKRFIHMGLGYSYRIFDGHNYEIAFKPGSHLAPDYLELTINEVQEVQELVPEVAWVKGPFSVQVEYLQSFVHTNSDSIGDYRPNAVYAMASYFITGESRKYKNSQMGFDRVTPKKNVGKEGCGAWEVAARYSRVDLNNNNINGGEMQSVTAGVNWYLNPVSRIMMNYVFTKLKDIGNTHIIETRFQIDF